MRLGETVRVTATDENLKKTEMRMLVSQKYLDARRASITGIVISRVHDGDLYYIRQSNGNVGAYLARELELV
ncbi:MAG: hypothetical protein NUV61_03620 [Candidatus Azambacteria bacterium]|nr:hypothetical protein [Candidatus Azambacteria bacterium]